MPPPEYQVICHTPRQHTRGDEILRFTLDGVEKLVDLRIGALSKSLVARLPDHVMDLIEIAALVYAIDSSVSRGGSVGQKMGAKWHRTFYVEVPVRCIDIWSREDINHDLEETLMFLSDDRFHFSFTQNAEPAKASKYFRFGGESSWQPDTAVMFSGGLDSLAGVLEEIVEREKNVALISHHSSGKMAKVQRELQKTIGEKVGPEKLMHIPIKVQLKAGTNREGTHRTRSFLFAALGAANAVAFGLDKVRFYENGIVSLNLPPVTYAVGTRATRTTHPQTLTRFTNLFGKILEIPVRIENPYFWRTKKDVVETINNLGFAAEIAHTRSCADVYNMTTQYPHCGRCSQCIDRRFAVIAAGLERFDPEEAYNIDLMTGQRANGVDKEVALSYVRSALAYEIMDQFDLEHRLPEINRVVAHLGGPAPTALNRMSELLRRHGSGVAAVMRKAVEGRSIDEFEPDTLPRMFGTIQQDRIAQSIENSDHSCLDKSGTHVFELQFGTEGKKLVVDAIIEIGGTTCGLLFALAQ
ncbi:MAG: hypothetical protein GY761_13525, partial [Hyphomicrobiales bacterium]|nr:hypothetical protein [Hyphomicrobiales bacterium]